MSNLRAERVGDQMKKELGKIISQKLKNPNLGFVTVTDVRVTGDLSQANVYVSVMGHEKDKENSMAALEKSKGFIRTEIGKRIRLRIVPEIFFEIDASVEYGNHIDELLRNLNKND